MLVVGETHGTNESPLVVSELVRAAARSSHVVIGLEFPKEDCGDIRRFLDTPTLPLETVSKGKFWRRKNQDGRSSMAMLRLITDVKEIRTLGMRVDIECFASYGSEPGLTDDESMARAIVTALERSEYADAKFLILTGNYHGRYSPEGSSRSMASLLRQTNPFTLLIRSVGHGASWNCIDGICKSHDFTPGAYLDVPTPSLIVHDGPDQTEFDGTLLLEHYSASPPVP